MNNTNNTREDEVMGLCSAKQLQTVTRLSLGHIICFYTGLLRWQCIPLRYSSRSSWDCGKALSALAALAHIMTFMVQ